MNYRDFSGLIGTSRELSGLIGTYRELSRLIGNYRELSGLVVNYRDLSGLHEITINPLRPNNDLSETSHCNIKVVSVSEVMRIENKMTPVKFY